MNAHLVEQWRDAVRRQLDSAVELRHELHADPRVGGDEEATAQAVQSAVGHGEATVVAGTGRLVDLGGEGPAVVLRAELDGLAITEESEVAWRSTNGVMHACGHDIHLAALTAVARAARRVDDLPGRLLVLLQPREEGTHSGAKDVVAEGHADAWDAVVAAHVQPQLGAGTLAVTPGTVNASTTEFTVEVSGRGGHSGYPHTVDDSVLALSAIVVALQQVGGGRVDPVRGCALMVTQLDAGTSANVVPSVARARGTVRTMSAADEQVAEAAAERIVTGIAAAHGCSGTVVFHPGEPALPNDPAIAASAHRLLTGLGHDVTDAWRSFGSDDFSHYAKHTRTLMCFVGTGAEAGGLHESTYVPDDAYVPVVADALVTGFCAAAGLTANSRPAG